MRTLLSRLTSYNRHGSDTTLSHPIFLKKTECITIYYYYKNVDLSRLGNRCCPGFPTGNACPGQKGVPFCPGCGNRDKRGPFVPVGNTNRDKRCCQRPRGWRTLLSRLVLFFMFFFSQFFFYFNYTFAFQLNLCIGIQCV